MSECKFKVNANNGLIARDYASASYVAYVPQDVSVDDLLRAETWSHVASRLNPWDRIEVRWEDFSRYAYLLVCDTSTGGASVFLEKEVEISQFHGANAGEMLYEVKFRGKSKWGVVRLSDGHVMQENIGTRDLATIAMLDLTKNAA